MEPIVGSINATLGPAAIAPVTATEAYFGAAQSLLPGIRILAGAGPGACIPHTLLSGQALECLLKAFLAKRGMPENQLRQHALRHNLKDLWLRANQNGLAIDATPPQWVESLSGLHDSPFYLRYPMGLNGLVLPGTEPMTTELEQLLEVVRQSIR